MNCFSTSKYKSIPLNYKDSRLTSSLLAISCITCKPRPVASLSPPFHKNCQHRTPRTLLRIAITCSCYKPHCLTNHCLLSLPLFSHSSRTANIDDAEEHMTCPIAPCPSPTYLPLCSIALFSFVYSRQRITKNHKSAQKEEEDPTTRTGKEKCM